MAFSPSRRAELARLADLYAAETPDEVELASCALVEVAVGGELMHLLTLGPLDGVPRATTNRPELFPDQARNYFETHSLSHPRVDQLRRHAVRHAVRLSEVVGWRAWQRSPYYQHCHRPLGIRDSLSFAMPAADGTVRWPVLLRTGRAFTAAERDHLEALRPHLGTVWSRLLDREASRHRMPLDVETLLRRHLAGWQRFGLTARETEVLAWLVQGFSYREIGLRLAITAKTVEHHVGRLTAKLGVRTRGEAVRRALEIV